MQKPTAWHRSKRCLGAIAGLMFGVACTIAGAHAAELPQTATPKVVILVYHRFSVVAADSMTVRTETFKAQLGLLRDHGYQFRPLRDIIQWLNDPEATLPSKVVVLTVDDGHRSVLETLAPIVKREHLPVTLFIYPSAISNASYALTWPQLRELRDTGLFDVQSHTWWHPNFKVERRHLPPSEFRSFVLTQLIHSRERIEQEVGGHVDMLAWPYGIYDDELTALAGEAGYRVGLTLDARAVRRGDALLALPRFLIVDSDTPSRLASRLGESAARSPSADAHTP